MSLRQKTRRKSPPKSQSSGSEKRIDPLPDHADDKLVQSQPNSDPERFERAFLKPECELHPDIKFNDFPGGLKGDSGVSALHPRAATAEPAQREPRGAQSRTLLPTGHISWVTAIKGGCGSGCLCATSTCAHRQAPCVKLREMTQKSSVTVIRAAGAREHEPEATVGNLHRGSAQMGKQTGVPAKVCLDRDETAARTRCPEPGAGMPPARGCCSRSGVIGLRVTQRDPRR